MPKQNKSRKTRKNHSKQVSATDSTMHGLHKWYQAMFEQLGWMVLSKSKGYNDKVETYKNSLRRLTAAIDHKIKTVHEIDRKNDLRIMKSHLDVLVSHVNKDFA
jgi:uncharacterized coiled-coil DUF342 family protein